MPSNWYDNLCAGEDWLYSFLKRNNDLSVRTPQATSLSRATSFNKHNVKQFFDNLCSLYDRFKFEPHNIYNVDETGVTTVHRPAKVIAVKGTKQVGSITSGERGTLVTVALAVSAIGNTVPPMLIFPRKKMKPWFLTNAPVGSVGSANQSGWMTGDDFLIFIKHFAKNVKPSTEKPVLLLLDNHDSHLNIEVLNFCKFNGIVLLSFPPHCSHKLQPLDRSVFRSFKTYTHKFSDSWMRTNHGRPMTIYDIPYIVKQALPMAATMSNIQSGFKVSGIWPYNPDIFTEEEFMPSFVTDRPQEMNDGSQDVSYDVTNNINIENNAVDRPQEVNDGSQDVSYDVTNNNKTNENNNNNIDQPIEPPITSELVQSKISDNHVSPELIRPFPKAGARKMDGKRQVRKRKSTILTDTPEKEKIQNEHNIRQEKKNKMAIKYPKKVKACKKLKLVKSHTTVDAEDEEMETFCLMCSGPYSQSRKSEKDWVQCLQCKLWAHVACTTKKNLDTFTCAMCSMD